MRWLAARSGSAGSATPVPSRRACVHTRPTVLWSLPNPLTPGDLGRLPDARPAGPAPAPTTSLVRVKRRVSCRAAPASPGRRFSRLPVVPVADRHAGVVAECVARLAHRGDEPCAGADVADQAAGMQSLSQLVPVGQVGLGDLVALQHVHRLGPYLLTQSPTGSCPSRTGLTTTAPAPKGPWPGLALDDKVPMVRLSCARSTSCLYLSLPTLPFLVSLCLTGCSGCRGRR